ncbi:MAG: metallophosphoesterase [Lachnospiraceae bacterium]|nr:metallophosphoesterase [Lachnospiraceae bacterium]
MFVTLLVIFAVIVCFFLLIMCYDCNRFVTIAYEIESEKLTKECKFVLLSDLHNKSFGKDNKKLLSAIKRLAPDAILVAGDMMTAQKGDKFHIALRFMEQLAKDYPIYYGMGNHEYRAGLYPEQYGSIYEEYMSGLHACGIEPLINETVSLPSANISICGLQMDRCYYKRFRKYPMRDEYLPEVLGYPQKDKFQLLIAHNPEYFQEYAKWGADLVVSGHVHGGLMRLPYLGGVVSPKLTLFPKYDGGRFKEGNAEMILSRGLGTHTLPIRIFNPGELIVIHLRPISSDKQ